MPTVMSHDDIPLYYEIHDYTDPWKNAPYLLLQHGWGRSSRFWYRWVPYLSRFYKVVRPDLRGLGLSSRNFDLEREMQPADYLDDLNALLDHLGAGSAHYCGESFGGVLGMAYAGEYPKRVRTLSIVSSPVHFQGRDKETSAYGHGTRMEALRKMGVKAWAEASNVGRRFPPDTDPGLLAWFVDETAESDVDVLIAMYRWIGGFNTMPYLPRIEAPVLGLYPTAGPIHGDEHMKTLVSGARNARIVRFASRFHNIEQLEPAACAREVLYFAAQHDGIPCHEP